MTRGEREVLEDVIAAAGRKRFLPKSHFDSFPHKRKIAKDLMWRGYLESVGTFNDYVNATPAGYDALNSERRAAAK